MAKIDLISYQIGQKLLVKKGNYYRVEPLEKIFSQETYHMLRTRLAILGSASALTLLTATASQAVQGPTMNFGTLKPLDQWKVGTVNANGLAYCAMVGKFDKQAVLAFARNPVGNSSLAVDFRESFFKPGAQYEVTLTPDSGRTRRLSARASSERSVVVQIGKDDRLFSDLTSNGDLKLELPSIDVAFALRKFSGVYPDLVECAKGLPGAESASVSAPDGNVQRDALAAEVDSITAGKAKAQPATKSAEISRMDEQLDRDAAAEAEDGGRRLIASAGPPPDSAADVPSEQNAARKQEQAEIAAAEQARKTAALRAADREQQTKIAAADAAKQKAAEQAVADYARKDESLKAELASAERKRDVVAKQAAAVTATAVTAAADVAPAAGDDGTLKGLRAQLIGMQGQVAALEQQRKAQESELTQKLAASQSAYESRIASLQDERDRLKQNLDAALSTAAAQKVASETREKDLQGRLDAAISAAKTSVVQGESVVQRLSAAEEQKKDLAARLAAMDKQNKLLQAALDAQKTQVSVAADGTTRAVAAEKIAAIAAQHAAETAALQKKLDDANALYARQNQELDAARARLAQVEGRKGEAPVKTAAADGTPLLPSERAELEEYRRNGGHALQTAASVPPPAETAQQQERKVLASTTPVPPAVALPVKPVISENLAQKPPSAPVIAEVEPSAGAQKADTAAPAEPKKSEITWDTPGYRPAPVAEPAPASATVAEAEPVKEMTAESAKEVAAESAVVPIPAPDKPNRAAAFLDKIMAYHRPGGKLPSGPLPEAAQIASSDDGLADSDRSAPPAPKAAARKGQLKVAEKTTPVVEVSKPSAPALADVAPSAGTAKAAPAKTEEVALEKPMGAVTLDGLLSSAGVRQVSYVTVPSAPGETVRQWTSGRLTGMIEQQPAPKDFDAAVQGYLARYRADCPAVKISAGPAQETPAGMLATATASCAQAGNTYTSSFVFVQTGAAFSAILHTGVPSDAAAVQKAGDGVAAALRASGGLAPLTAAASPVPTLAPSGSSGKGRGVAASAARTQKLNVSYAPPAGGGEFQTVYVQ
jgi:hypothetical protein